MNKRHVYSVKQLTGYIKNMFTQDFLLGDVSVKGEISNLKDHPSGHIYFTLKDKDTALSGVMFAGKRLRGLKCRLREGLQVIVTGSVNIYEASGRYQIYASEITEEGEGDLHARFLELKKKLEELGMFDAAYKRPIPKYARTVGIVTASSGAALQDIRQIAARRNPYVQLILSPAIVQGESAPESIIAAIERLDAIHPDVMIVGRGGGSEEDLMAFNDEGVAYAIFNAETPVISAVGHEVDFTIADFVSDLRAPTPSAAAELAVFELSAVLQELQGCMRRMETQVTNRLELYRSTCERMKLSLKLNHPEIRVKEQRGRLEELQKKLDLGMDRILQNKTQELKLTAARLDGASPLSRLTNGFGYISKDGSPMDSVSKAAPKDLLKITLHDGEISAAAVSVKKYE